MKTPIGRVFLGLVLVLAVGILGGSSALAQQRPKMPADFAYKQVGKSPGKATFSHEKHFDQGLKCTDCHVKVFKMKLGTTEGPVTMARMEKGELCGTCHIGGKKGPKGQAMAAVTDKQACGSCHKK